MKIPILATFPIPSRIPIEKKLPIPVDAKPLKKGDCYCGKPAVYKPEGKRGYCSQCWADVTANSGLGVGMKGGGSAQG